MVIFTLFLSPQANSDLAETLSIDRLGMVLNINGQGLDLSFLEDGDILPPGSIEHPLLDRATISRVGDSIEIKEFLFHIDTTQTDPAACFPEPLMVGQDGPVELPPQFRPPELEPELSPEVGHESEEIVELESKEDSDVDQY